MAGKSNITTRKHSVTVINRIKREPRFAAELLLTVKEFLFEGEPQAALSVLRDLVHGTIGFPKLAKRMGVVDKSLYRMLSGRGNPTTKHLSMILKAVGDSL